MIVTGKFIDVYYKTVLFAQYYIKGRFVFRYAFIYF